jgi:tetratricopeptide (TPR) repeat protein
MRLAERYVLGSLIGQGGMGAVYQGRRLEDDQELAVKVISPNAHNDLVVPRFLREARLAARIHHPNVVQVYDFGRCGEARDAYFLAMELVPGLPLSALLDVGFETPTVCFLVVQVLDALAHVHARGVLHRDIKPDNILVTRTEGGSLHAKVLDFGIAAALGEADATRLTAEGSLVGTPAYMAPEQVEGASYDSPTLDLYPVGVLLYRMLSGGMPFEGRATALMVRKLSEAAPPLIGRYAEPLPADLCSLVAALLERDPADRPPFAADAREALLQFARDRPVDSDRWSELAGDSGTAAAHLATHHASLLGPDLTLEGARDRPTDRLFGRDAELATLDRFATEVEDGAVARMCLLEGEAGVGKSVLLESLSHRLAEAGRFQVLRCATAALEGSGGGLRAAFDRLLGTGGRGPTSVEQSVRAFLRRHGDEDEAEVRSVLTFLRPELETESDALRQFAVVGRCLRRMARLRPVLVSIDDLVTGGAEGLTFVENLLTEAALDPFALFVVAGLRRDRQASAMKAELDRFKAQGSGSRQRLALGPLPEAALSEALVHKAGIRESRALGLARRAAGNPLFAFLLAEQGTGDGPAPTLSEPAAGDTSLPERLKALLERRLHQSLEELPRTETARALLETVAVLGGEAPIDLLEELLDDAAGPGLEDDLDALLDARLLEELPLGEKDGVQLQPPLLTPILQAGMGRRRRRRLHGQAARLRIERAGVLRAAEAAAIGDHLEGANELTEAARWWSRAADLGSSQGSAQVALRAGLKALAALPPGEPGRGQLALATARLLFATGDLREAADVAAPLLDDDDLDLALQAVDVLSDTYENSGQMDAWKAMMARMEGSVDGAGPTGKWAWGCAKTLFHNALDRFRGGLESGRFAVEHARPGLQACRAWRRLSYAATGNEQMELAVEAAERCIEEAGDHDAALVEALRTYGWALHCAGRLDESARTFERARDAVRQAGRVSRFASLLDQSAQNDFLAGRTEKARAHWTTVQRLSGETGLQTISLMARLMMAYTDLEQGATDISMDAIEAMLSHPSAEFLTSLGVALSIRISFQLALGQTDAARRELEAMDLSAHKIPMALAILDRCAVRLGSLPEEERAWAWPQRRRLLEHSVQGWTRVGRPDLATAGRRQLETLV